MSAPPGEGYGQVPGQQYGQYSDEPQYDEQQPPAQAGAPDQAGAGGKKKKRGYAAGAFEVGSGANAAVGGQTPGGVPPQYGAQYGQPQQPEPQQPAAQGYQYPQQGYPAQQQQQQQPPQPAYGGYQAPDQGYPAPGAAPGPAPGGVAGITQGMGGMQLGGQPQQQQSVPASQLPRAVLNQLYPTDLLNQPFNASELDLPPPPINLPPNVSWPSFLSLL